MSYMLFPVETIGLKREPTLLEDILSVLEKQYGQGLDIAKAEDYGKDDYEIRLNERQRVILQKVGKGVYIPIFVETKLIKGRMKDVK